MNGFYTASTAPIPDGAVDGAIVALVILACLAVAPHQWGRINTRMERKVNQLKKDVEELKNKDNNKAA